MKKGKWIYLILLAICFIGCFISIYYPYLIKLNVRSGNLDLPNVRFGYEYSLPKLSLTLLAIIFVIAAFTEKVVLTFFVNLLNLGCVYFIRESIHFQGFIDHDYDTKTGIGFHLLFSFSMIQLIVISVNMIKVVWVNKRAAPNTGSHTMP